MNNKIDFDNLVLYMKGQVVDKPNKASFRALSDIAAGEPFEKKVYHNLKDMYPDNIFKQYEYLNDIYLKNPKHITVEQRQALFSSPTALFLLSRGDKATRDWSPENIFEEKQDDTADILFHKDGFYNIVDVKTRNHGKNAQAPNIISAYKLAQMCAYMLDNEEFDNIAIDYIEIDWIEDKGKLKCVDAHHCDLFKTTPKKLYINWAAAMQIQFHVCDVDQTWRKDRKQWAIAYIKEFVASAKNRCKAMHSKYIEPFLKYIKPQKQ